MRDKLQDVKERISDLQDWMWDLMIDGARKLESNVWALAAFQVIVSAIASATTVLILMGVMKQW